VPLQCCLRTTYGVAGQPAAPQAQRPVVGLNVVSEGYFNVLRIPIAAGRLFTIDDRTTTSPVGIVNETFARRLFPGRSAIGQGLLVGSGKRVEIIGVIRDVKDVGAAAPAPDELYLPLSQFPQAVSVLAARTGGDATALQSAIRHAVSGTDSTLAVSGFATLESAVATNLGPQRLAALLTTIFATLALVLALGGLYAVLAYLATQRTVEIGIRMALGATRGSVLRLMLYRGLVLVGVGLVIGLGGAGAAAHVIRQQLFGVESVNVGIYAAVSAVFGAVAAIACLVPAVRASRVDPLVAFRLR